MDTLLQQYVFPEFGSAHGHMRARACWVLHYFSEIKFKQEQILAEATMLTVNALLTDTELPVKVEAAIALQMLLTNQERCQKYLESQVITIAFPLDTHHSALISQETYFFMPPSLFNYLDDKTTSMMSSVADNK